MATLQVGNIYGVAAVGGTGGKNINGGDNVMSAMGSLQINLANMRTRLNTIDPTYWTETFMDQMTYNDLVYALRLIDDPDTI